MNAENKVDKDHRFKEIAQIITNLISDNFMVYGTPSAQNDDLDKIIIGLNTLSEKLLNQQMFISETEERIEDFSDMIIDIASLNFTKSLRVGEEGNMFDAIAVGLNALSEELAASTVSIEYLDNILYSMMDTLVVTNPENRIQKVNKAILELLGYTESELLNQPIEMIFTEETVTSINSSLLKGVEAPLETTFQTKDGTEIPMSLSCSRMEDNQGKNQGFVYLAQNLAERKKIEEELRTKDNAIRSSLSAIAISDIKGNLTYINPSFLKIWGYDNDKDVLGRSAVEFWHREEFIPEIIQKIQEEGHWFGELVGKKKNGEIFNAQVSANLISNPEDNIIGIMASFVDITKLKRTERKLQESEERLRKFMDSTPDSLALMDSNLIFIAVNKTGYKAFGKTEEEIIGKNISEVNPHLLETGRYDQFVDVVKTGKSLVIDELVPHPQFGDIYLSVRAFKVGEGLGLIITDITKRKKAEIELKKSLKTLQISEESLQTLLNSIDSPVLLKDRDGTHITVNKTAADVSNKTIDELIGSKEIPFPPELVTTLKEKEEEVIRSGKPVQFDVKIFGNFLQVSIFPIFDAKGNIQRLSIFTSDITKSKNLEHKLQESLQELQTVNKELKDFAYVVSHDLKAPLRGIRSLADWLLEDYSDKLDDQGKELLALMSGRVDLMNKLIQGILDYSRIGRDREETSKINVDNLLAEVIDLLAPPENISFIFENEITTAFCDRTRLQQIFQNLLSNAITFMDKPHGTIKIRGWEEGQNWKFSVSDNGPGIESKYHEKIFQPFQTLTPRDEQETSGVGLALVKKIIENYGGTIWVESKVGSGSTFFFNLPKTDIKKSRRKLSNSIDKM